MTTPTPMDDPAEIKEQEAAQRRLAKLVATDRRYSESAYHFIFAALDYTQKRCTETGHVTGQQLCDGIRQFAIDKFGMMAKAVLNNWGICRTDDIGTIVFNLIENDLMKKTDQDTLDDFKELYDMDEVFVQGFRFDQPLTLDD